MQNKPYPAPYLDDLNHLYKSYFIKENDLDELNAEIMAGKVTDSFLGSLAQLQCYISEKSELFNKYLTLWIADLTQGNIFTEQQLKDLKTITAFYFIQNFNGKNFYFYGKSVKTKEKTKKQALDLYLKGLTRQEIARKTKKSLTHVYNIIREYQAKNE